MIEPINARKLINNGWTIKNRRFLRYNIGKDECEKLYDVFCRVSEAGNAIPSLTGGYGKLVLKSGIPVLSHKNDNIKLMFVVGIENLKTKFKNPLTFINENITVENIDKTVRNLELGARKSYNIHFPETELESATLKTLYSPEFAPKRRIDKNGYAVTTVIDNKTKKPVEVYVKRVSKTMNTESWGIYTKEGSKYNEIGFRSFGINEKGCEITPGYMETKNKDKRYSGIGLRLHQIAIERMMQTNCNNINIESVPNAFAFHYKAGFRLIPSYLSFTEKSLDSYMTVWSERTGVPAKKLKNEAIYSKVGDLIFLDNKTIERFMLKYKEQNYNAAFETEKKPIILNMTLPNEWLETWKTMAQLQPILL